jgi:limonene-1,2-epoxide hydrolase
MSAVVDGIRHAFVTGDVSAFPALVAEGAEIRGPLATVYGPDGFAALASGFCAAFADREIEILRIVAAGDAAVVEQRVSGRHVPSGQPVTFVEAAVVRLAGGRIAAWHAYYDTRELEDAVEAPREDSGGQRAAA